jgi:hypothetical protein
LLVEVPLQRIELPPPKAAVLRDPVPRRLERIGREPAATLAPHLAISDEAGAAEHADVLEKRGQRHRVRPGELAHRRLALHELLEDGAPDGVGEGGESRIERTVILNLLVYH